MGMRERASENAHSLWIYFTFQFSEFSLMFQLLSKYLFFPQCDDSFSLALSCLPSFVKYRYRFQAVCGYFFPTSSSFLRISLFFLVILPYLLISVTINSWIKWMLVFFSLGSSTFANKNIWNVRNRTNKDKIVAAREEKLHTDKMCWKNIKRKLLQTYEYCMLTFQ